MPKFIFKTVHYSETKEYWTTTITADSKEEARKKYDDTSYEADYCDFIGRETVDEEEVIISIEEIK